MGRCLRFTLLLEHGTASTIPLCIADLADWVNDPLFSLTLVFANGAPGAVAASVTDVAGWRKDVFCEFSACPGGPLRTISYTSHPIPCYVHVWELASVPHDVLASLYCLSNSIRNDLACTVPWEKASFEETKKTSTDQKTNIAFGGSHADGENTRIISINRVKESWWKEDSAPANYDEA